LPFASAKFALNFLLFDSFRSKIFERHFFNYLKSRITHSGGTQYNKLLLSSSCEEIGIKDAVIENGELLIKSLDGLKHPLTSLINEANITTVNGQARFIHPFGEYIGHCELEDCATMKSVKADYYVICNSYFLPVFMRYIK
jgi:hypothetical protein